MIQEVRQWAHVDLHISNLCPRPCPASLSPLTTAWIRIIFWDAVKQADTTTPGHIHGNIHTDTHTQTQTLKTRTHIHTLGK